jgi:hypothetical protein
MDDIRITPEQHHRRVGELIKTLYSTGGIPVSSMTLRRHSVDTLHQFLAVAKDPAEVSAIQYELTRRQGRGAVIVSWLALAVSVGALAVSIIWHN